MAAYHKAPRSYLGVSVPAIEAAGRRMAGGRDVAERVALARGLWASDVHEARIAAAKLLTQARIREDEPLVWAEFLAWVPDFDAWAIADHACKAGERRLVADPSRLDLVEGWTGDPNMWVRRAALVATLPWSQGSPTRAPSERAARERILGWAEALVPTATGSSRRPSPGGSAASRIHDPARARAFVDGPGRALKPFARREALRRLGTGR